MSNNRKITMPPVRAGDHNSMFDTAQTTSNPAVQRGLQDYRVYRPPRQNNWTLPVPKKAQVYMNPSPTPNPTATVRSRKYFTKRNIIALVVIAAVVLIIGLSVGLTRDSGSSQSPIAETRINETTNSTRDGISEGITIDPLPTTPSPSPGSSSIHFSASGSQSSSLTASPSPIHSLSASPSPTASSSQSSSFTATSTQTASMTASATATPTPSSSMVIVTEESESFFTPKFPPSNPFSIGITAVGGITVITVVYFIYRQVRN